jgi:predicted transcriptional regulator
MPELPSVKQRIWQALRLTRRATVTELCIIVEASRTIIYRQLRDWIFLGLVKTEQSQSGQAGKQPLIYSLIDPNVISPPEIKWKAGLGSTNSQKP